MEIVFPRAENVCGYERPLDEHIVLTHRARDKRKRRKKGQEREGKEETLKGKVRMRVCMYVWYIPWPGECVASSKLNRNACNVYSLMTAYCATLWQIAGVQLFANRFHAIMKTALSNGTTEALSNRWYTFSQSLCFIASRSTDRHNARKYFRITLHNCHVFRDVSAVLSWTRLWCLFGLLFIRKRKSLLAPLIDVFLKYIRITCTLWMWQIKCTGF